MKSFFMDRCPKDKARAKYFVWIKAFLILKKNLKNLLGGGGGGEWHAPPGHQRVKYTGGVQFTGGDHEYTEEHHDNAWLIS